MASSDSENRFGTGRLTLTDEGPRFEEIAHVSPFSDDESRQVESISLGSIAADAKGNSQPVISVTRREANSAGASDLRSYRLFSLEGKVLRDFAAPTSPESMPFDDKPRLWRYLDRPLELRSKPAERQVNWTDFEQRRWTEKIVLQRDMLRSSSRVLGTAFTGLTASAVASNSRKSAGRPASD